MAQKVKVPPQGDLRKTFLLQPVTNLIRSKPGRTIFKLFRSLSLSLSETLNMDYTFRLPRCKALNYPRYY